MSASSLTSLPPRAFRALIGIAQSALQPTACPRSRCDDAPCRAAACRRDRDRGDVSECGFLLNRALREIHRLRSGLTGDSAAPCAIPAPASAASSAPLHASADRPIYAVRPLGEAPFPRADHAGEAAAAQRILSVPVVTNLGTLMDVLI